MGFTVRAPKCFFALLINLKDHVFSRRKVWGWMDNSEYKTCHKHWNMLV